MLCSIIQTNAHGAMRARECNSNENDARGEAHCVYIMGLDDKNTQALPGALFSTTGDGRDQVSDRDGCNHDHVNWLSHNK